MKNCDLITHAIAIVVIITGCNSATDDNANTDARQAAVKTVPAIADQRTLDFLSATTEMRKMNTVMSELARQKSTSHVVQEYAALLVEDQIKMSKEIAALVEAKKIILPKFIDLQFNQELAVLRQKESPDFDRYFIDQLIKHHEDEERSFREALTSTDADVKIFALNQLPVIERNLQRLHVLRRKKENPPALLPLRVARRVSSKPNSY
jgi:predicted outer membrane protein